MKEVELYTDGACSGNPGPGGWGAILRWAGKEKEFIDKLRCRNGNLEITVSKQETVIGEL